MGFAAGLSTWGLQLDYLHGVCSWIMMVCTWQYTGCKVGECPPPSSFSLLHGSGCLKGELGSSCTLKGC